MPLTERPMLIYDGECGICRSAVTRLRLWDRNGRLDYVPFQDSSVARFGIELPALAAAMHLLLPDGRHLVRAETIHEFTTRAAYFGTGEARTLGWQATPTGEKVSSAGTRFGPHSFGH